MSHPGIGDRRQSLAVHPRWCDARQIEVAQVPKPFQMPEPVVSYAGIHEMQRVDPIAIIRRQQRERRVVEVPVGECHDESLVRSEKSQEPVRRLDPPSATAQSGHIGDKLLSGIGDFSFDRRVENQIHGLDQRTVSLGLVRLEPGDCEHSDDQDAEGKQDSQPPARQFAWRSLGRALDWRVFRFHGRDSLCGKWSDILR